MWRVKEMKQVAAKQYKTGYFVLKYQIYVCRLASNRPQRCFQTAYLGYNTLNLQGCEQSILVLLKLPMRLSLTVDKDGIGIRKRSKYHL